MANLVPAPKGDIKLSNPQKAAAAGLAVVGGVIALAGLYAAMPYLLTIGWGLVQLAVAAGILCAAAFVATDKEIRRIMGRLYRQMIWKAWWKVMTYDPIGSARESIAEYYRRYESFKTKRQTVRGQITSLGRSVATCEEERDAALKRARAAQGTKDYDRVLAYEGGVAGRRKASIQKFQAILATLKQADIALTAAQENMEFAIKEAEDKVNCAASEFIATNAAGAAAEDAMAIINGDPELKRMFQETMGFIDGEISNSLGKVDMMMTDLEGAISSVDAQKGVYRLEAIEALAQWGEKSKELRLPAAKVRVDGGSAVTDAESVHLDGLGTAGDDAESLFADEKK